MRTQISLKSVGVLIALLAVSVITYSQKTNIIGLTLTGERTSSSDFVVGVGGSFETQLSNHVGLETGLYFRTFPVHQQVWVNEALYGTSNTREKYLSIPLLCKFYSSVLNFSIGPTFDIYMGWKHMDNGLTFPNNDYAPDTRFKAGLMGKVSKAIKLTNVILLEPEIRYNPVFSNKRSYLGIGVSVKYKLAT